MPANALANFERISAGSGNDLIPVLDRLPMESKLVRIAKETVAIEQCEEQLKECELEVKVRDLTALENTGTALLDLRERRNRQLQRLLSLVRDDVSQTLIAARMDADMIKGSKLASKEGLAEERRRKTRELFVRVAVAVFAGLTLLAPMLIMVLHPTLITVLLTTSVFVTAIAIILAFALPTAETKDIVGATAAYAAVLVIFVGTGGDYTGAKADVTSGWNMTAFGNTPTITNLGQILQIVHLQ